MAILVTGGNGFVGSAVVRTLIERGHAVRCLLRPTSVTDRIEGLPFERTLGDVRDREALRRALAGCEAVVHLASPSSWDEIESPLMQEVVERGTSCLLELAGEAAGVRVVFVSSVAALGGSSEPELLDESSAWGLEGRAGFSYARSKHRAEEACRSAAAEGRDVVIVNPGEVYGPRDTDLVTAGNLIDLATSWPVLVCNGGTSVVHVDDVALGIVLALERGCSGERYILGGQNLSVRELAVLVLELVGRRAPIVTLPNPVIRAFTRLARRCRIPLPYNPLLIPYATRYWFVDNSKAKRTLRAEFRSARDTLRPTIDWLRESGLLPGR